MYRKRLYHVAGGKIPLDIFWISATHLCYLQANTSMITLKYNTCETFILDQTAGNLTYCLTDWVRRFST